MKYIFYSIIFAIISLGFAPVVSAQQQINNNGANGSELQQQSKGNLLQNAPAGQQTSPVTQNGGVKSLQNLPNKPLTVTGVQQPTAAPIKEKSIIGWVLLGVTLLFLLMSPAFLYARNISQKNQSTSKTPATPEPKNITKTKPVEPAKINDKTIIQATKSTPPKKKHKKSTNKVKRGKKKK